MKQENDSAHDMSNNTDDNTEPVRDRLLKAALDCFLADEYHKVTTRLIAKQADANISMIRDCFGNKQGLYEEMIRETLNPLLEVLNHVVTGRIPEADSEGTGTRPHTGDEKTHYPAGVGEDRSRCQSRYHQDGIRQPRHDTNAAKGYI